MNLILKEAYNRYLDDMRGLIDKGEADQDEVMSFEEFEKEWLDHSGDYGYR